ncbi:universal stress protein, partial [uncultured Nocardioides sp.]|uniref:universal stress protein n=1 Tax=uncultured Nocardioides sp. TaxID=198441 RepID=UPI0026355AB8
DAAGTVVDLEDGHVVRFLTGGGFAVDTAVVPGEPERALARYVGMQNADLLVMGAYGHSRIRHLIVGSTTTTMLRTSAVPVLILR